MRDARVRSPPRFVLLLAALVVVYFGAGRLGLQFFGLVNPSASAVWPPTGVAVAAMVIFGYRVSAAIFVGAFLVNIVTAAAFLPAIGIAGGNTLEALTATYLIRRFAHGNKAFRRAFDTFEFGAAIALGSMLSAASGVATLWLGDLAATENLGVIGLTWWLGDTAGGILLAPLLVLWYLDPRLRGPRLRVAEALAMFAAISLVAAVVFLQPHFIHHPLAFLAAPPLLWAAFRFKPRDVATGVTIMTLIATWATAKGRGPFAMPSANESLVVLQAFTVVVAMAALIVAALVQERAALLRRARRALRETETALRSRDAFLAMLSHELRNPLSAISASAALLGVHEVSAEVSERARRVIQRQTGHLTRLIEDLLDVARISAGTLTLDRHPVDLAEIVDIVVLPLYAEGSRSRPRIELQLEPVWVDADADRLQQVVANIVQNAIKHTPAEGSVRVGVFGRGEEAVLEVVDNGAGIAADLLPKVFDLFVQRKQGIDRSQGGLGVGLALVRRIAELHGGTAEAFSEGPGRGSTFTVRLPRIAAASPPAVSGDLPDARRQYKILLVEDNKDARESLHALLQAVGHEVDEAPDGETGVRKALDWRPDFALVDIGLPGIDGYEVAHRIRAADPSVRLLALTGYGREEDRARAARAGFDAHLVKPVALRRLLQTLEALKATSLPAAS